MTRLQYHIGVRPGAGATVGAVSSRGQQPSELGRPLRLGSSGLLGMAERAVERGFRVVDIDLQADSGRPKGAAAKALEGRLLAAIRKSNRRAVLGALEDSRPFFHVSWVEIDLPDEARIRINRRGLIVTYGAAAEDDHLRARLVDLAAG